MKSVLITGKNSYIGTRFQKWAETHHAGQFRIDSMDMHGDAWKKEDFSSYDVVFHVAGIAHSDVGNAAEETKALYYAVNTDLALETCEKARRDGVSQFVFMSSIIVYGDSAPYGTLKRITAETIPAPANFYGDSKWQADQGVRAMAAEDFAVAVLRPPMIYGKGSKGNYPMLARLARTLPVFPRADNERSILYIDNLCEFLCQIMLRGEGGVFFPQNAEYGKTWELVREIADVSGHRIAFAGWMNWAVRLASRLPGRLGTLTNKAFGNLSYDRSLSEYDFPYRVADLRASIERTER